MTSGKGRSILAQLGGDPRQYLHDLEFRFRILPQSFGRDFAQIFQRCSYQCRGRLSILVFFAKAATQMIGFPADGSEPVQDRIDEGAVLLQITAALIRYGVELLRTVCL